MNLFLMAVLVGGYDELGFEKKMRMDASGLCQTTFSVLG